jgi:phage baseplate assembly protein W
MARADFVKSKLNPQVYFSDFSNNLDMAPFSGDVAVLKNVDAVSNSVQNIVLTLLSERLYNKSIGCSIGFQAFEVIGGFNEQLIDTAVRLAISQNEPRATVVAVNTTIPSTQNALEVIISFYVVNNPTLITVSVIVVRSR